MAAKDALGKEGEELAVRALKQAGLQILDRNWRCSEGELDVVARHGSTLAVCEVKTRSGTAFGSPLDAVTPDKLVRVRRLAAAWLKDWRRSASSERGGAPTRPTAGGPGARGFDAIRFDVVGVLKRPDGSVTVEHVQEVG